MFYWDIILYNKQNSISFTKKLPNNLIIFIQFNSTRFFVSTGYKKLIPSCYRYPLEKALQFFNELYTSY